MEAIILAGGRGTRLSSVVPNLPKPLAPVNGRPFLSYVLASLAMQGFTRICLSTGYMADAIEQQYGTNFRNMELVYVQEESPLGTGGAIRAALASTATQDIFVLNGDTLARVDFQAMMEQHRNSGDTLTIALTQVTDTARYGAVTVNDSHVTAFSEKGITGPGYINAGIYLMRRSIFTPFLLPEAFSFEQQILMEHFSALCPGAFLSSGYFIDIGVPEDYMRAQQELPVMIDIQ